MPMPSPCPLKPSTARCMTRAEMRALAYMGAPYCSARDGVSVALARAVQVLKRSAGVYGVYVFQTLAQAVETYGEQGLQGFRVECFPGRRGD